MKEVEAPEIEKYNNFLIKVREKGEIWLLQATEGMFAMIEDNSGQEYMPVWTEKDGAQSFANDDWYGYTPNKMSLFEFMGWLKELDKDQVDIAVSPELSMKTIPIKAGILFEHLSK